jgi:hypothetical protein
MNLFSFYQPFGRVLKICLFIFGVASFNLVKAQMVYVTNANSAEVSVIDVETNAVARRECSMKCVIFQTFK